MRIFGMTLGSDRLARRGGAESEPTGAEAGREEAQATPHPEAIKLVELVRGRYRESARHRRMAERDWVLSVAMYEGRQWLAWDDATHRAISLQRDEDRDRYVTHNLVRPLTDKLIALATMTRPDATPAPQSDSPKDRAAAQEARVITAHLYRIHERTVQTQDVAFWAATCGVGYLKEYWDASALADVAVPGPDGAVASRVSAPVGEVCSEVVPPFEVYCDPRAKRWEQVAWIIHATVKPLAWIEERYGVKVEPTHADQCGSYTDAYLPESGAGGYGSLAGLGWGENEAAAKRSALLLEMWEKPTPAFPQGRLVVVCGERLLHQSVWPLKDRRSFPFIRLAYGEAAGHVYGLGLMPALAPLQVELNRMLTKAVCEVEDNKNTLLREKGSGSGADAYTAESDIEERRTFRTVWYEPGARVPMWQGQPPVPGDVYRLMEIAWTHMQHIAGIHEVNMGGTPTGITAGISIELLQQGDRTQLGLFTQRIEQFAVRRDECDIALYAQFASGFLPRLMGLDDSGNPATAQMRATAFRALTAGGACRVLVTPGSATPKSPAGKTQEILEYFKLGLFDPMNPAAETVIRLLSLPKSDEIIETLRMQREEIAAAKAREQAMQQMLQQQTQQLRPPALVRPPSPAGGGDVSQIPPGGAMDGAPSPFPSPASQERGAL